MGLVNRVLGMGLGFLLVNMVVSMPSRTSFGTCLVLSCSQYFTKSYHGCTYLLSEHVPIDDVDMKGCSRLMAGVSSTLVDASCRYIWLCVLRAGAHRHQVSRQICRVPALLGPPDCCLDHRLLLELLSP